jgi:hypothetical protein
LEVIGALPIHNMYICIYVYIYIYMYRQIEQKRTGNSISWVLQHENQNTVSSTVACGMLAVSSG